MLESRRSALLVRNAEWTCTWIDPSGARLMDLAEQPSHEGIGKYPCTDKRGDETKND